MPPSNHASTYRQGEDTEGSCFTYTSSRQAVLPGCLIANLSKGLQVVAGAASALSFPLPEDSGTLINGSIALVSLKMPDGKSLVYYPERLAFCETERWTLRWLRAKLLPRD